MFTGMGDAIATCQAQQKAYLAQARQVAKARFRSSHPGCKPKPTAVSGLGLAPAFLGPESPEWALYRRINPGYDPKLVFPLPAVLPTPTPTPATLPPWNPLSTGYPQWVAAQQAAAAGSSGTTAVPVTTATVPDTTTAAPTDISGALAGIPWWGYVVVGGAAIWLFTRK